MKIMLLVSFLAILLSSCSSNQKLSNFNKKFDYHKEGGYLVNAIDDNSLMTKRIGSNTIVLDEFSEDTRIITIANGANAPVVLVDRNDDGIVDELQFDVIDPKDVEKVTHYRDTNADGQWDIKIVLHEKKVFLWLDNQWLPRIKKHVVIKGHEEFEVFYKDNQWQLGNKLK